MSTVPLDQITVSYLSEHAPSHPLLLGEVFSYATVLSDPVTVMLEAPLDSSGYYILLLLSYGVRSHSTAGYYVSAFSFLRRGAGVDVGDNVVVQGIFVVVWFVFLRCCSTVHSVGVSKV